MSSRRDSYENKCGAKKSRVLSPTTSKVTLEESMEKCSPGKINVATSKKIYSTSSVYTNSGPLNIDDSDVLGSSTTGESMEEDDSTRDSMKSICFYPLFSQKFHTTSSVFMQKTNDDNAQLLCIASVIQSLIYDSIVNPDSKTTYGIFLPLIIILFF